MVRERAQRGDDVGSEVKSGVTCDVTFRRYRDVTHSRSHLFFTEVE